MTWEFLIVVIVVVLVPGLDLLMVLRNTVAGGQSVGAATIAGVGVASTFQGTLVAVGVGALVVQSQWLFQAIKWVGTAYLIFLGVQSLRAAFRRISVSVADNQPSAARRTRGFLQGFLCNITNPKMLVFYLSLLPQFVGAEASLWSWLVHAWALPIIGSVWLLLVAVLAASIRERLLRPLVRRVTDGVAGIALVAFGAKLAIDR
jgi:threonine/homoserine/homoserine lactone efflux protein